MKGVLQFSKREVIAMHFASGLIAVRDREGRRKTNSRHSNASVMRDAFAFADAFLNEENRPEQWPAGV